MQANWVAVVLGGEDEEIVGWPACTADPPEKPIDELVKNPDTLALYAAST
jgi:hypothetical protein